MLAENSVHAPIVDHPLVPGFGCVQINELSFAALLPTLA
jgi:hypothetical protein